MKQAIIAVKKVTSRTCMAGLYLKNRTKASFKTLELPTKREAIKACKLVAADNGIKVLYVTMLPYMGELP